MLYLLVENTQMCYLHKKHQAMVPLPISNSFNSSDVGNKYTDKRKSTWNAKTAIKKTWINRGKLLILGDFAQQNIIQSH